LPNEQKILLNEIKTSTAKKFTPEHEYIVYDSTSKIGVMSITDYAQKSLGDVVFVELPSVGTEVAKGGEYDLPTLYSLVLLRGMGH
jgi:glycine cleavage system H lipoate-binding protein